MRDLNIFKIRSDDRIRVWPLRGEYELIEVVPEWSDISRFYLSDGHSPGGVSLGRAEAPTGYEDLIAEGTVIAESLQRWVERRLE